MIQVRNWKKFQHFKDRRPPWIKLYRDLLDDPDWHELSGDDAKALMMLWLIASEDEGKLPDIRKLAFRLRTDANKAEQLLNRLSHWLIQDDIAPISDRYQDDTPETETETETENKKIESGAIAPDNRFGFLPPDDLGPTQSAEDEFWEIVNSQGKSGALSRAMMVKHAKLSRDFHDSVSCIKSALRAKDPRTYLGKAISNISEHQRAPPEPEGF